MVTAVTYVKNGHVRSSALYYYKSHSNLTQLLDVYSYSTSECIDV